MIEITFGKSDDGWVVFKNNEEIGLISKREDQVFLTFHVSIDPYVDSFETLEDAMENISENW